MSFQTTALLLSWVAILLLSLVVAGLVRQVHALAQGPPATVVGPPPGSRAPGFDRLGGGLLLFLSADCGACEEVLAAGTRLGGRVTAIFPGPALPAEGVTVHANEPELFESYGIPATPFAVLVGASGRVVRSEPVGSAAALDELVVELRNDLATDDRPEMEGAR